MEKEPKTQRILGFLLLVLLYLYEQGTLGVIIFIITALIVVIGFNHLLDFLY
jgi:hypothetical protein